MRGMIVALVVGVVAIAKAGDSARHPQIALENAATVKSIAERFLVNQCGSECFVRSAVFLGVVQESEHSVRVRFCLVGDKHCPAGASIGVEVDRDGTCRQVEGAPVPNFSRDLGACCSLISTDEVKAAAVRHGLATGDARWDILLTQQWIRGRDDSYHREYQWVVSPASPNLGTLDGLLIDACNGRVIGPVRITRSSSSGTQDVGAALQNVDIVFHYGVRGRNKLNTVEGTFTKDLIGDPPATTDLRLTNEEKQAILEKAREVGFFSMPAVLRPETATCRRTPCSKDSLSIDAGKLHNTVQWDDCVCNEMKERDRMDELGNFIRKIIEGRREYQALPKARGLYY